LIFSEDHWKTLTTSQIIISKSLNHIKQKKMSTYNHQKSITTTTTTTPTTTRHHSSLVTVIMDLLLNKTSLAFIVGVTLGFSIGFRVHQKLVYHRFVKE
jgi:hypothetical protein